MQSRNLSIILVTVLGLGTTGFVGCGGSSSTAAGAPVVEELATSNQLPVFTSLATTNADENQNIAIDVDAMDADGDTLTYSKEGGIDAESVVIDAVTGEVVFVTAPNFEVKNKYQFTVGVSDGGTVVKQDIVVNINDIAEGSAPVITSSNVVNVDENQKNVLTINATDIDGDILTYSIEGGADATSFDINSTTGIVTFKNEPDYETKNLYTLRVGVSDVTDTTTQDITVNINDLDGTSNVVRTGQTIKYEDGDDGDLQAGKARSFTDTGGLSGTVIDHATELEWKDNSTILKKDLVGVVNATKYCSELVLNGKKDWYLPSIQQLYTIADRGSKNPAIFSVFDYTKNDDYYWSSTTNGTKAYGLNFVYGADIIDSKTNYNYVRCVRNTKPTKSYKSYNRAKNGIVTDKITKLQWKDPIMYILGYPVYHSPVTWKEALDECKKPFAGKNDWRLPNINELLSITYKHASGIVKAPIAFKSLQAKTYFSSTTSAVNSGKAWVVNFSNGQDAVNGNNSKKLSKQNVICVRTMGD